MAYAEQHPAHDTSLAKPRLPRQPLMLPLIVGAVITTGAFMTGQPHLIIAMFFGLLVFVFSGLRLELLVGFLLVNVLVGSARLFESSIFNLNRLLGVAIFVGLLFSVFFLRSRRLNKTRIGYAMIAFGIASFITVFTAQNTQWAAAAFRVYIRVFLLFFLVSNLISSRGWLRFYMLTVSLTGIFLVIASARSGINEYSGRMGGTYALGNANYLGLLLATLLPLSIWGFRYEPDRKLRVIHLFGIVSVMAGIFLTQSRGALVSVALVILIMAWVREINPKLFTAGVIVCILALPFASGKVFERFATVWEVVEKGGKNLSGDAQNVMNRINYIRAGIPMFAAHPIVGVGINNYGWMYPTYVPIDAPLRERRAPHNTYLQVVTETGLVGTIPFFLFIMWSFQTSYRLFRYARPRDRGDPKPNEDLFLSSLSIYLFMSLAAFCLGAFFVAALTQDVLWVVTALIAGLPALYNFGRQESDAPASP